MRMVDITEWMARLRVCRRQVEIMIARGEIPAPARIGKLRRWSDTQIDQWIAARTEAVQAGGSGTIVPPAPRGRPRAGSVTGTLL
jgi:excisionase family DNA binding protein